MGEPGDHLIGENPDDHIGRTKGGATQHEREAGTGAGCDQRDDPYESPDRDGYSPPPPEDQTDEEHRRDHDDSLARRDERPRPPLQLRDPFIRTPAQFPVARFDLSILADADPDQPGCATNP